jgi:hypothetical protein
VLLALGASCSESRGTGTGTKDSERGMLQDIPVVPVLPPDPPGEQPPGMQSAVEPTPPTGPELPVVPVRPVPRSVTDFESEAQEPTPRAADARGLGGACRSTAECRPGLGCADVVFTGTGESNLAGGYCSRWCEQDADCAALDPGSLCSVRQLGSNLSFCLAPCQTGETPEEKCGGRQDVSCGFTAPAGYGRTCLPNCTADSDCVTGRCNAAFGLCDARLSPLAAPVGSPCQANTSCNGVCEASFPDNTRGICTGYCRLGSTCGDGAGNVCAALEFGVREGDGGSCEHGCSSSDDCIAGYTACAPTGRLLASGEREAGCSLVYGAPASLAPQRLSVEQLAAANIDSRVMRVSTTSIFQGLSHRLDVQDGAVCVTGNVVGVGALVYLDFQLRPINGAPVDASAFSAFTLDVDGPHLVRLDAYAHGTMYRYLSAPNEAGALGEGPQRVGFDQLFDIFNRDTPFLPVDAAQLDAVQFTVLLEDNSGPFRLCIGDFALAGPVAADAGVPGGG